MFLRAPSLSTPHPTNPLQRVPQVLGALTVKHAGPAPSPREAMQQHRDLHARPALTTPPHWPEGQIPANCASLLPVRALVKQGTPAHISLIPVAPLLTTACEGVGLHPPTCPLACQPPTIRAHATQGSPHAALVLQAGTARLVGKANFPLVAPLCCLAVDPAPLGSLR